MSGTAATHDSHPEREEFLTAQQLAAVLQVSAATIRRLAQQGRIPSIRLTSRLLRFHLPAVRDALDGTHRKGARRQTAEAANDDAQLSFADML